MRSCLIGHAATLRILLHICLLSGGCLGQERQAIRMLSKRQEGRLRLERGGWNP